MKLSGKEKFTYGLGAVAKDMVYMLSAGYILYYYQDIMGVSAWAMGIILMAARVFDAFNDPIMGVVVSKTKTRWGKFRPWLMIGTITNAVILFLMFSAPPSLNAGGMVAYAAVTYILWGVTYTMMDIPYWSMVPAFTNSGKEREGLSAFARSAAGVGSALVSILTVLAVSFFGTKFSPDAGKYQEVQNQLNEMKDNQTVLIAEVKNSLPSEIQEDVDMLVIRIQERQSVTGKLALERANLENTKNSEKKIEKINKKIGEYDLQLAEIEENINSYTSEFITNGVDAAKIETIEDSILRIRAAESAVVKAIAPLERIGYKWFSLIVAVIFILFITIMCICIKEKSTVDMKSASVGDMFKALFQNDQAMTMVIAIVCINTALYITSNLVIYFFKYDFSPANWEGNYTLFNTCGGGFQILAMMLLFPLFRKFMNTMKIFYTSFFMALAGYVILLIIAFTGTENFFFLLPSAFLIMSAIGMLNVVVTVFLANTVDYGELKNNRRDEAVIFSMQTFVVKLASGLSALIAGIILSVCHISKDALVGTKLAPSSSVGLRMCMTLIPMAVLIVGALIFKAKYKLTDAKMAEIGEEIAARKGNE